jgi:amino acid permease
VLLEIQDTLKQPPQAAKTMKKAMNIAITGAFAFYLSVAVTGYSALGLNEQMMPGQVLEGFTGE